MFDTSKSGLRGLTVLIVEDDFYIGQWLGDEVLALGGEVKGPVSDEGPAKEIVEAEHIDFAILDVKLRDKLVFPLADLLLSRGIPYFFETGYDHHLVFLTATLVRRDG